MARLKIRPYRNMRIHAEPLRCCNGITVGIDRHNRVSVLRQTSRELACPTADLKDLSAFGGKESFDEIVCITRLEPHFCVI